MIDSTNMFRIVRRGERKVLGQLTVRRKPKSNTSVAEVQYVASHHVYGNPFGKDPFYTSESTLTDKDLVERRQMVFAVELILTNFSLFLLLNSMCSCFFRWHGLKMHRFS